MDNPKLTHQQKPDGASCNANVSTPFYIFLALAAVLSGIAYLIFK